MSAAEILAEITTRTEALLPVLHAKQAAFRKVHGRAFQGKWTHSTPPEDGALVAPDLLAEKPSYQPFSWADLKGLPATMASRARVDQYVTPAGAVGYVLTQQVRIAGALWERSLQSGPETWRAMEWHTVAETAEDPGR